MKSLINLFTSIKSLFQFISFIQFLYKELDSILYLVSEDKDSIF